MQVFSPPVSELIKRELGIEKGSGSQAKYKSANASIEQIIKIAKTKFSNLLCNDLKSAVKTVVGSCVSLGVLIENKPAVDIGEEIDAGKYDKEINAESTETPEEKKKELTEYFIKVKEKQDILKRQEEIAEEAKEEKAKK